MTESHSSPESARTPRRAVLQGVAVAGAAAVAGPALSACGSDSGSDSSKKPETLGAASDVPVGGGTVYAAAKVVVTQPTKGTYHAFSAVCTHMGCTVGPVKDGTINCHCHQSRFSVTDGSVKGGPAPSPLPKVDLKVEGGKLIANPDA